MIPQGRRAKAEGRTERRWLATAATAALLLSSAPARGRDPGDWQQVEYDGRVTFVRLQYASEGGGRSFDREPPWAHDYPRADSHFMTILKELTYTDARVDGGNVFSLDDPELTAYPVAYMSEPGFWYPTDDEAAALGAYLQKGGFVIFDDFRDWHWQNFEEQMRRALPDAQLVELDATHPIFHSFYEINSLDFVQFYDRDRKPIFYGIFEDNDPSKRLMVIANYNNDIGEYWEYSDTGWIPIDLSNEAYKLGVNYVIYAMTH
jgi:hypothetical protein